MKLTLLCAMLAAALGRPAFGQSAPRADHHQHLFSPGIAALISPQPPAKPVTPITADDLIPLLDAAGIERAVVLSVAYILGSPARAPKTEYEAVKAENDWTSQQVGRYPSRLRGFCGLNPLKSYALDELARCVKDPNLRFGLKLHFGNSVVDYHDAEHVAQVRRVFQAANRYGMAIVVHMRASFSEKLRYGADEAHIFLNEFVAAAPDVTIQIAHLAGGGGPVDPSADEALAVFVDAVGQRDPLVRRVYYDVTGVVTAQTPPERAQRIAASIRALGVDRILYGTDAATNPSFFPREAWSTFRRITPLSDTELSTIAGNVPPYLR